MSGITRKIALEDTEQFDAGDFSGQLYVPNDAEAGFNALLVTSPGSSHPRLYMSRMHERQATGGCSYG